jgi:hypothetical protein
VSLTSSNFLLRNPTFGFVDLMHFSDRNDRPEQRPEQPHDIAALAAILETPDSLNQQDIYDAVCTEPDAVDPEAAYRKLSRVNVSLRDLQDTYNRGDSTRALARLHYVCTLTGVDEFVVPNDDPNYCFTAPKSFLDYIMVVGSSPGLGVFIPNVHARLDFQVQLDVKNPLKQFRARYGTLGFNPTGSMLCIGSTPTEDMWIGLAPDTYFDRTLEPFNLKEKYGDTRLGQAHYRITVIFLAHCLSMLEFRAYKCRDPYTIDLRAKESRIKQVSNIL